MFVRLINNNNKINVIAIVSNWRRLEKISELTQYSVKFSINGLICNYASTSFMWWEIIGLLIAKH